MSTLLDGYINDERVKSVMRDLEAYRSTSPDPISDITDDRGHQYVDLVMEGGGVLGIALVGYAWALERAGIRFVSIGGTSAGSINALLMAAVAPPSEARSEQVLEEMAALKMMSFVDGGPSARSLVRDAIHPISFLDHARLVGAVIRNLPKIRKRRGINPGDAFRGWIGEILERKGVTSTMLLTERMNNWGTALYKNGQRLAGESVPRAKLRMVSADLTMKRKAVFPDDAQLYFRWPRYVNPALYVRASMSVPYFFEPLRVGGLPTDDRAAGLWRERAGYEGERLPEEVLFVDGGIISNFPISLFHKHSSVPRMPTFGAKLGAPIEEPGDPDGALKLAGAMFGVSRAAADTEFLRSNPDYNNLIAYIDTGAVHWLNFDLTEDEKHRLFAAGARSAVDFLTTFNWADYKKLREKVRDLSVASEKLCRPAPGVRVEDIGDGPGAWKATGS